MGTENTTDIVLQKQKMWELAKVEFIKEIPKEYNLVLDGMDDDSKYFHPLVTISDDLFIHSQCDTETDYVYGISLKYKGNDFPLPDKWYEFAFCKDVHSLVIETYNSVKEYDSIIQNINSVKSDLMNEAIFKFADNEKLKKLSIKAFNIKEFIENKMVK